MATESDRSTLNGEVCVRRVYRTPSLRRLGGVNELTLSNGQSPHQDGQAPGLQRKVSPPPCSGA